MEPTKLKAERPSRSGDTPIAAATWADSQHANHSQARSATLARWGDQSSTVSAETSVMILHADPVIAAGLTAVLREHPCFQLVPTPAPGNARCGRTTADVVVADYESALELMASASLRAEHVVIFTNHDSEGMEPLGSK